MKKKLLILSMILLSAANTIEAKPKQSSWSVNITNNTKKTITCSAQSPANHYMNLTTSSVKIEPKKTKTLQASYKKAARSIIQNGKGVTDGYYTPGVECCQGTSSCAATGILPTNSNLEYKGENLLDKVNSHTEPKKTRKK